MPLGSAGLHAGPLRTAYRPGWRWFRWRGLALIVVFSMGVCGFQCGVGTSERAGVDTADLPTHIYYALGLFVLGGLDLGLPDGGPIGARLLLWMAYFLAPAITTSALIEATLRVLRPQSFRLRMLRNHTVVFGCGRLGLLYLRGLRESGRRCSAILVDKDPSKAQLTIARHRYGAETVHGVILHDDLLATLRLGRCAEVVVATRDDFVNLDAATRVLRIAPHLAGRVLVHVSDNRLLNTVLDSGILAGCRIFNSHSRAARHLVAEKLRPRFLATEHVDTVLLAGFGRFGQTVLDELHREAHGHFHHVIVMDRRAGHQSSVFEETSCFPADVSTEVLDADVRDPHAWRELVERRPDIENAVLVIGTDDPGLNIRTALSLSTRLPEAYVVARCFAPSALTEEVSLRRQFDVVATSELLLESLREDWFQK